MNQCSVEGCDSPCKGRGYCAKHYARWRKRGTVELPTVEDRFWAQTCRSGDCILWTGHLMHEGYGVFYSDHRRARAHRWIYERTIGPIPAGLEPDHLCRVRNCVNVQHLELVTHAENVARGISGQRNRVKTHCPKGHALAGGNLYVRPSDGARMCRECQREAGRRYKKRSRA